MRKQGMTILMLMTLLLTGCDIFNGSSENSLPPSETPVTSSSEEQTVSEVTSISVSEDEQPSEGISDPGGAPSGDITQVLPIFQHENAANLSNFVNEKITDPVITYTNDDYSVKPFPHGFTYPTNANVQPTRAYLEFWHPETSIDLKITATPLVFSLIQENGLNHNKELYFPVTLQVIMNGKEFTYYEVGMRMKGNTSRREFVNENGYFFDNISFKLSFKELWTKDEYAAFGLQKTWTKADEEYKIRDDRTFMGDADSGLLGMKKIDIKWNKSQDNSLIMQPFVFSLFQKHGAISQNSTLATLRYNDAYMGVVTVNEPIDKHLLRRYFTADAAKGHLYKVGWGYERMGSLRIEDYEEEPLTIGVEDKFAYYEPIYDRKEGKDDLPLINLMTVLRANEGKSPAQYKAALEAVVDMDSFLEYAALSYLTGNPDDLRNNGNNYYIFFNPVENNKAYFIPYDYDWSMGLTWGPDLNNVSPLSTKHKGYYDNWQKNRLYWYTMIESNDNGRDPYYNITINRDYQNAYINKVHAFNQDEHFSVAWYNTLYQTYKATYQMKTKSVLDNNEKGEFISPFAGTSRATNYIKDVKRSINTFIPR